LKQRPASTSASPYLDIHSVLVAKVDNKSISIPIALEQSEHKTVETLALIDSGAGGGLYSPPRILSRVWQTLAD